MSRRTVINVRLPSDLLAQADDYLARLPHKSTRTALIEDGLRLLLAQDIAEYRERLVALAKAQRTLSERQPGPALGRGRFGSWSAGQGQVIVSAANAAKLSLHTYTLTPGRAVPKKGKGK